MCIFLEQNERNKNYCTIELNMERSARIKVNIKTNG